MNDLNKKTILTTDRLILRTWGFDDIPLMAAINSNPIVLGYIFPLTQDSKTTENFIYRINEQYNKYGYSLYAVNLKSTGEFIGFVGLNHPDFAIANFGTESKPVVEIGWRLSVKHWGKAYATEAAKAVLKMAFEQLKLNEIVSFTVPDNKRSIKVMEKIGMTRDVKDDFIHPKLPCNHRLSLHVLFKIKRYKKNTH